MALNLAQNYIQTVTVVPHTESITTEYKNKKCEKGLEPEGHNCINSKWELEEPFFFSVPGELIFIPTLKWKVMSYDPY